MNNGTMTIERLRHMLAYDPETGIFTWLRPRGRGICAGDEAGSVDTRGYRRIKLDYRIYLAHRLAWFHVHGEWPSDCLDHVNGLCSDNRIANLRPASKAENQQNRRKPRTNSSGFLGVSRCKRSGKWTAQICNEGRLHRLGRFDTPEQAHAAYVAAKARLHKFQPEVRTC